MKAVIAAFGRESGGGLVVMTDSFMRVHRGPIIAFAARHNVPAVYPPRVVALEGGLMAYSPYNANLFRRAAPYVDRILRDQKPAHMPVQMPTLEIPVTVLVGADR